MYSNYNMYVREETDSEVISITDAINLIKKSIDDEKEDQLFYEDLLNNSSNEMARKIIMGIYNDEKKHQKILKSLYDRFTNSSLPLTDFNLIEDRNRFTDYKKMLEKAMFGELNAVKKYRRILGAMPDMESYTLVFSILSDELMHADLYNYIIANLS